jgi:short-subunit dehydrogenase
MAGLPAPSTGGAAVVTGASSGIGTEIARGLAARGHAVILVARREERLRTLATELEADHGVDALAIACDLGDPGERDRLESELGKTGRKVEILVNNAGYGSRGRFAQNSRERMVGMVNVNVEAVVDLTARVLPGMIERGRGCVINVASNAAYQPMPGGAVYAASKAFVLSFSEAIHAELKGAGVQVTAVCPGPVKTEFADAAGMEGVEETAPELVWTPVEEVAKVAIEGAERGKRVVNVGMVSRVTAIVGQHSPRFITLPVVDRLWTKGTQGTLDE